VETWEEIVEDPTGEFGWQFEGCIAETYEYDKQRSKRQRDGMNQSANTSNDRRKKRWRKRPTSKRSKRTQHPPINNTLGFIRMLSPHSFNLLVIVPIMLRRQNLYVPVVFAYRGYEHWRCDKID
jgi:hypothetical protein